MESRERILSYISARGPTLPAAIAKEVSTNILLASAMLSELSGTGKLKVSKLKIGSSPLYYLPGQEEKLENFSDSLNQREREAFELLKNNKVLRDTDLNPITRVCLKLIKDFALPLQVTLNGTKELFWKWYSLPDSEVEKRIRYLLVPPIQEEPKKILEPQEELYEEPEDSIEEIMPKPLKKILKKKKIIRKKVEKQEEITPKNEVITTKDGDFHSKIETFFSENDISIMKTECIVKNKEYDFIIQMETPVGKLEFYCKAKNMIRVSDKEISSAFVQGQIKKLPVIFLTDGQLTKKAKELLEQDLKGINVKQI